MCKTCARPVQTVLKNRGRAHILYSHARRDLLVPVRKPYFSAPHPQPTTPAFSTEKINDLPLSIHTLSTLSTRPITNTTIYKN